MLRSLLKIFSRPKTQEPVTERLIKTEFPPYLYYDKDFELASTIKGLSKIGHCDQKPLFEPYFYYKVDQATTEEDLNLFLESLPHEFQFQFSKRLAPTSVASTRVIVQRQENNYLYHHSSHGQSNVWHSITRPELLRIMTDNKDFQYDRSFRAYRMTKKGIEGQEAF